MKIAVIGLFLNLIWLPHIWFKAKGDFRRYLILGLPYIGGILYFIFYVWQIPHPAPKHLQMNKTNHHGRSEWDVRDSES